MYGEEDAGTRSRLADSTGFPYDDNTAGIALPVPDCGDWIQTFSGRKVRPLSPDPETLCIEDIAHALANQCRFTGHVREFYSIAQHCVLVSLYCPPEDAFTGLMHDSAEAYLCDIARPVKYDPRFSFYKVAEKAMEQAIAVRFNLPPEPDSVKKTDRRLLYTERRDLLHPLAMANRSWGPEPDTQPLEFTIVPWLPKEAEQRFLSRFKELTDVRN